MKWVKHLVNLYSRFVRSIDVGLLIITGLALLALPFLVNTYYIYIASLWIVIATAGLGLVILLGWSGQIGLAQPAFFGIGAYGTTYLFDLGWPWLFAALTAACSAAVLGALVGFPATRLRGFYLAIATLAFGELLQRAFIEAKGITGGVAGKAVAPFAITGLSADASRWYLCLAIALGTVSVLVRMRYTSYGRRLRVIRDAEIAAPSLEINPTYTKLGAFALSAFIGGLAGAAYAQTIEYLTPDSFGLGLMLQLLVVVFVGGVTYVSGPFLGAAIVVVLREFIQDLGQWQNLIYGFSLAIVISFLPEGLASLPSRLRSRRGQMGQLPLSAERSFRDEAENRLKVSDAT